MQKGFTIPTILIAALLLIGGVLYFGKSFKKNEVEIIKPSPIASQSAIPSTNQTNILTGSVKHKSTIKPTIKPTSLPSSTPAPTTTSTTTSTSSNATPSNPYDLNSATGSVKVMVLPQGGNLVYTPSAELYAVSGFKVLDGRSSDKLTAYGPNRNDDLRGEINFATVPPGPYKVRISYNGVWSDQKDVTVSSAKQTTVDFSVTGQVPTPTPTPSATPVPATCQINASPKSGSAPLLVSLSSGASITNNSYITAAQWDFDGNGSWDTDMSSDVAFYGYSHTFTEAGTYNIKMRVQLASGYTTDSCSETITVTP
ncbi:hypothetical protein HY383_00065 [Candidatus Daviesbacteria bacterium]|nr:hypothetical protein [Candidatus Daviesbacteria bacterium]